MILDRLEHAAAYRMLSRHFADGFDYLLNTDFDALADGRYSIDGDAVVAVAQTYPTKSPAQGRWEAHRRHADIQYVFRGRERMGVAPIASMTLQPPYDSAADLEFYTGSAGQQFVVEAGSFAIFFPHDIHMPSLAAAENETVKKIVIKVLLG